MLTDAKLRPVDLVNQTARVVELAGAKSRLLKRRWKPADGSPVFTVRGRYGARGWTEWTQGFQFGIPLYVFDATGDGAFLDTGRAAARDRMAVHLTHTGAHDHGFNNMSTYGNLLRLAREGAYEASDWETEYYELALKVSGAVQASRWTPLPDDLGYVYSFNGPHSLFADTIRSLRVMEAAYELGHVLLTEHDEGINLLRRAVQHAETTARFNVYFGAGRDAYDVRGRVAHESIFNLNDGRYRCAATQQGYSPLSTWTRGLAWILLGFAEQIEYLSTVADREVRALKLGYASDKKTLIGRFEEAARAVADFYVDEASAADGVPYWDTGAPGLADLGDWRATPADPYNAHEPVDASAAAIAAQGLLRLGATLRSGARYTTAGLTIARTLFSAPYLCDSNSHEGLLLHSVYHRPNGWDYVPKGRVVPSGESSMWGDYHLVELAVLIRRLAEGRRLTFFDALRSTRGN